MGANLTPWLRTLKIRTKNRGVIGLEPNWAQREIVREREKALDEDRPCRIIVLKARQLGVSTIAEALLFHDATTQENTNAVVIAHDGPSSEHLFNITKHYYETWEYRELYPHRYATRRQLTFDNIGSNIWVMTAEHTEAGRGRTIMSAHLSELAFWGQPAEAMLALNQAIPALPGTFVMIESTANGMGNFFEDEWIAATSGQTDYVPLFFPWWKHPEYIPCQGVLCLDGTCPTCEKASKGLRPGDDDERQLLKMGASLPHIAWRRWAIPNRCMGSLDFFRQEFPGTAEEAFLVSGVNAFPENQLKEIYEPMVPKVGRLVVDGKGKVRFQSDPMGPLRMYKQPAEDDWGVYFIGADPCQPPGTLVRTLEGEVPIEDISVGDKVVSMKMTYPQAIYRRGRKVTEVRKRAYAGELVNILTPKGRSSAYTAEHRCVVRLDQPLTDGNHIVYMQQRGDDFRIGRTVWRRKNGHFGLLVRALRQQADAAWVLSVHERASAAALDEAVLSTQFGIPLWQFLDEGQVTAVPLAQFWDKMGGNRDRAQACLKACGRDIRFPLYERTEGWKSQEPVVIRACNLLSGMTVLEPDEIRPTGPNGWLAARKGCGGWTSAEVSRFWYEGPVYSLHVEEDHTYVADGIVTHNCYGLDPDKGGDYAAAQVINRRNHEQVAVWHGRINPIAFGDELAKLGHFYRTATLSVEVDGPGIGTIARLERYPRIWRHRNPERSPGKQISQNTMSWQTNWKRKQWLVGKLQEVVERQDITIHDAKTFKEMRSYAFFGMKGYGDLFGPASKELHDDLVMALGIAVVCESTEPKLPPYDPQPQRTLTDLDHVYGPDLTPDEEEAEVWG